MVYSVAILISYALQGFVPYDMIWNACMKDKYGGTSREFCMDTLLRLGIVIVSCRSQKCRLLLI